MIDFMIDIPIPPVPPAITTFGGDLNDVKIRAFEDRIALHILFLLLQKCYSFEVEEYAQNP